MNFILRLEQNKKVTALKLIISYNPFSKKRAETHEISKPSILKFILSFPEKILDKPKL